jgi:hypothetical protein
MTAGTAMLIIAAVYLAANSQGFRTFLLVILGLGAGTVWYLADFGADKPQTIFYNSQAHPAFLMKVGDTCPADRHVWNHWCVR